MRIESGLEEVYVRGLIAIARADREIDADEGARLDEIIKRRELSVSVAEMLFEPTLRSDEVVKALGPSPDGGPFRNSAIAPNELGKMFVTDALEIMAAHEGLSSAEEAVLLRLAPLFGLPVGEARQAISAK